MGRWRKRPWYICHFSCQIKEEIHAAPPYNKAKGKTTKAIALCNACNICFSLKEKVVMDVEGTLLYHPRYAWQLSPLHESICWMRYITWLPLSWYWAIWQVKVRVSSLSNDDKLISLLWSRRRDHRTSTNVLSLLCSCTSGCGREWWMLREGERIVIYTTCTDSWEGPFLRGTFPEMVLHNLTDLSHG